MKKIFLLVIMAGQFLNVSAFRIEYGNNVIISQPVYEDLYIAGGTITINAPVHGDLIIAGGTVTINDTVTNDILIAGGNLTFNGYVGDDVRCAGGNLRISKNVAGDLVAAGGEILIDKGVVIENLIISGGNVTLNGEVRGEVRGAFGKFYLNGNIAKNIDCRGGTISINGSVGGKSVLSAPYIVIGDNAVFNNDVRYWTEQEPLNFKDHIRNGKAIYDPGLGMNKEKWYFLGATSLLILLWYIGMALLMILIVQYLFARSMKYAANTVFEHSLKSFGFGLLFFIGVPVIAVITLISVIGLPVGLLLIFTYIVLILLATVISSVVAANWFNNRFQKNWSYWQLSFTALGIFALLKLIFMTPVVGGIILTFVVCMSFGAILLSIPWKRRIPAVQQANSTEHQITGN